MASEKRKSTAVKAEKKSAPAAASTKQKAGAADSKKAAPAKRKVDAGVPKTQSSTQRKTSKLTRIIFLLRFRTEYGQELLLTGDHPLLGDGDPEKAIPLQYLNESTWMLEMDCNDAIENRDITYHYLLRNADGITIHDWGHDKKINPAAVTAEELLVVDAWNHAGYFENTFYTEPFSQVLLKKDRLRAVAAKPGKITHVLKVKAPLLTAEQTLCVLGSGASFGNWDTKDPLLMQLEAGADFYQLPLDLSKAVFPIAYKYGVYDLKEKQFIRFEDGNNRELEGWTGAATRQVIIHDGFAVLPNTTWKGAGIAIPVFSLRTENSFGVGEFTDLQQLADWSASVGLKMIQLLPVNDTTATHSWTDSYPYAAISAFALHPMYLNPSKLGGKSTQKKIAAAEKERKRLNALASVDYEAVNTLKWELFKAAYAEEGKEVLQSDGFLQYFNRNSHWLEPYAVFCYLRDQYGTVDFSKWPAYKKYAAKDIAALTAQGADAYAEIGLHYYIQYQLHLQLQEATAYAHSKGIIVKGDIAIGVYRHGADAWQHPELYHLDFQAGAPPDDFAVKGQNWGFPTYNWQRMREDGFAWWKQRFAQMSDYFDAFRIDHILGFFRIWSIPMDAVEGILGHFVPAIPVHVQEFHEKGIWFDYGRYTKPYITENVLWEVFGYDNELVKSLFLVHEGAGQYKLKPEYATQRLVEAHFATLEQDAQHEKIKQGLYDLISNVILFEVPGSNGQQFHFRFSMESTSSFRNLEWNTGQQLKELYIDYFFRRQDAFWKKEALQKLPDLKSVTNMMICGEDLGLVPGCVPDVMRQLGLLSLEIQRMPKDPQQAFFHPAAAPYLSVVTPSTHDMSTIRGWWEEDHDRIQQFYNHELGQWGDAPPYCEAWINKAIVWQHFYSPAMWSVFQLQDLLGIDAVLRRENPHEERINIPANPKHYWQYRMHLSISDLMKTDAFNEELRAAITASGR